MTVNLHDEHKRILIKELNDRITTLEKDIRQLQEIKDALINELGVENDKEKSTPKKSKLPRLSPGVPKKWVIEAMQSVEALSISMIMDWTEKNKPRRLRDAPIRRALKQLLKEKRVRRNEDGSWSWVESGDVIPDVDDDDLPF
ncbi:MAG: hypothetical protein V3V99_13890 [candidate division Zixibacteria bacterium]